jgi:hypothetical protein
MSFVSSLNPRTGKWGVEDPSAPDGWRDYQPEDLAYLEQLKAQQAQEPESQAAPGMTPAPSSYTNTGTPWAFGGQAIGQTAQNPYMPQGGVLGGAIQGAQGGVLGGAIQGAYQGPQGQNVPTPQNPQQAAQMVGNPYMQGMSAPQYQAPQSVQNPYLQQVGQGITQQLNQNLQRNLLPGIGRNAIAAGGFGGSRQGVAEGIAIGDTQNAIANNLASMYSSAYNTDTNAALNRYGTDTNFYTNQRGQDLTQQNQGYNQYMGNLSMQMDMGQRLAGVGQQEFNAPVNAMNQYANILNPLTGLNTTITQPGVGGGASGALGGALTGWQLYNLWNGGK